MKKFLLISALFIFPLAGHAADLKLLSCGPGFMLVSSNKLDGINSATCQKLWCRDLENGKSMGSGDRANSGYKATNGPSPGVEDSTGRRVDCFGDRKWCANEVAGIWNPEFGAYTRGGVDSTAYISIQKGDCFGWQMQKPECEGGQVAYMQNGVWVCAGMEQAAGANRASSIRRTGAIRVK